MGARRRARTSPPRRGSASMAAADVGRPHRHALLPGGDRRRQRADAQRPRHLALAAGRRHLRRPATRALPLYPPPPGVPRRTARARRSAPTSPVATPPRSRSASRSYRGTQPASPPAACRAGEHIFDLADTAPRPSADGDPVRLLSRDRMARRPGAGRDELAIALSPPARSRAGCAHTAPSFYLQQAAQLGARVHRSAGDGGPAEPVRRQRPRALRARPGTTPTGQPVGPRRVRSAAHHQPARQLDAAVGQSTPRSVRLRLRLGASRHRLARLWPLGDGRRVRSADRIAGLSPLSAAGWATCSAQTPGARR